MNLISKTAVIIAIICVANLGFIAKANAQEWRIVASVNGDVITSVDLYERLRLAVATSGLPPSQRVFASLQPQVLSTMINERLRYQQAQNAGIIVNDSEISKAIADLEKQNKNPPGSFYKFLEIKEIPVQVAQEQFRAQIAWTKYVMSRIRPSIKVTDEEAREEVNRTMGKESYTEWQVSRIFLPVSEAGDEIRVKKLINQISDDIIGGANFSALAQQISTTTSRYLPSERVWLQEGEVDIEIEKTLFAMKKYEISEPIRAKDGYHIIKIHDWRKVVNAKEDESEVLLHQAIFPLPNQPNSAQVNGAMSKARNFAQNISSCQDFEAYKNKMTGEAEFDSSRTMLNMLNKSLKNIVGNLEVGEVAPPFRTPYGVHVLLVCEKISPTAFNVDMNKMKNKVFKRKLESETRNEMRKIRRNASVDIKI